MSHLCDNRCGHQFFESNIAHVPEGYIPSPYYLLESLTPLHERCLECVRNADLSKSVAAKPVK